MKKRSQPKQAKSQEKKIVQPTRTVPKLTGGSWNYKALLAAILVISFVAYLPVLNNDLLDWDDQYYITANPMTHSIDLPRIFSSYLIGNYHPLTVLVLAVEYQLFGSNATGYHAVNLLLHLLNVVLVFNAVLLLSRKPAVSLVAALLFGIHPLHVESVAWAAELKDLLYTSFFLASYIFYLKYLEGKKQKFYLLAIVLFAFSLLSKAMAASLPVVLLLTDYFKGRTFNKKVILEKIPFFLLAIGLGFVAIKAQESMGATEVIQFPFYQRLVFASYGFITYLVKLVFPLQLSAYYPYPIRNGESLSIWYYAYPVLVLGLGVGVYYSLKKTRKILFGLGFYAITIFLVLQLLPVGGAIIADRYSYIPSIGIFYLAGEGVEFLRSKKMKWPAFAILAAFSVFFIVKTYTRATVWKNDLTLWNDVISKYQTVAIAYHSRAYLYMEQGKNDLALEDLNKAIEIRPGQASIYYSRALLLTNQGKIAEALADYDNAIQVNPNYVEAFVNRGNLLRDTKKTNEALESYQKAIEINPNFPIAYFNRGSLYMNAANSELALRDFDRAIELDPGYVKAYFNKGNVYLNTKKYDEAIAIYSQALSLKQDYAEVYYNKAIAEFYSGKKEAACNDIKQSLQYGYQPAAQTMQQICN